MVWCMWNRRRYRGPRGCRLDPTLLSPGFQLDTTIRDTKWCCRHHLTSTSTRTLKLAPTSDLLGCVDASKRDPPVPSLASLRAQSRAGAVVDEAEVPQPETTPLEVDWRQENVLPSNPIFTPPSSCWLAACLNCASTIHRIALSHSSDPAAKHILSWRFVLDLCDRGPIRTRIWRISCQLQGLMGSALKAMGRPPNFHKKRTTCKAIFFDEAQIAPSAAPGTPTLRSLVRIDHPSVKVIKALLSIYPLVTAVRCSELTNEHVAPCGEYVGRYNFHRYEQCVVLVGYTHAHWIVLNSCSPDLGDDGFFLIQFQQQSGIGEFILLPQADF